MKIKLTNIVPKKLEKKNTNLFILDIYIQREDSFYISVINNKFEHTTKFIIIMIKILFQYFTQE